MAESSSTESVSGLDYEETELKLALPGAGRSRHGSEQHDRKRGFSGLDRGGIESGDRSDESLDSETSRAGKPPAAKAQVVGWPPVRSYRKNALRSCTFVKVAVDGVPYLRKVDLEMYEGYKELLIAVQEMFSSCFTLENQNRMVDAVNGTEYVPTYEDRDGDWMMVGDVPWKMFVGSCKRLRLMKSSEVVNLAPRDPQ